MFRKVFFYLLGLLMMALIAACSPIPAGSQPVSPTSAPGLANPASVYCGQQGGKLEMRPDAAGGTTGICVFPDRSECEEWAYFRAQCKPGDSLAKPVLTAIPTAAQPSLTATVEVDREGWKIYRNTELGYRFAYPANTRIIQNDEPLKSISIGPLNASEGWPSITISHPRDREDYHPTEGADLLLWLTSHNLLGEKRLSDVKIAGATAVHVRHDRSPQSFVFDRYYFAKAGQLYVITIGHTEDKEDWQFYNHFLESFQFEN